MFEVLTEEQRFNDFSFTSDDNAIALAINQADWREGGRQSLSRQKIRHVRTYAFLLEIISLFTETTKMIRQKHCGILFFNACISTEITRTRQQTPVSVRPSA